MDGRVMLFMTACIFHITFWNNCKLPVIIVSV